MKPILKGHLAAAAAYTIFGLNIVFGKNIISSGLVSPTALFTFRAAGAALLFWFFSLWTPKEKVAAKDYLIILLASVIGLIVPQMTFLKACQTATAIDISIISTLTPVFTMFIAAIALKEPISVKKAGGVAMSFAGIIFLILNSVTRASAVESSSALGIVLLLVNQLSFASYLGIFKPVIRRYSVVTFMKWMFLFALIVSLPVSMRSIVSISYAAIPGTIAAEIGFMVVFATFVAYFLIPLAQKNIRPTLVGMYSYLQPIIAATVAIVTGMDRLNWQKILATLLVVGGVIIVNRSRARQQQ